MVVHRAGAVDYPTSDGRPMAETDTHRDQMVDLIDALKRRYAGRDDVYVSGNLLLFYEPGNKHKHVSPDVMVVFGVPPGDRDNFLIWEEHAVPTVVFEITSKSTRKEDTVTKKALYLSLGVKERYMFDPTSDYLRPPLQGWHAGGDEWVRVHDGCVHSPALSLELRVVTGELRLVDPATSHTLLTSAEAEARERTRAETERTRAETERARAETEHARAETERARAETERARAEAAEEEVRRLRARLGES